MASPARPKVSLSFVETSSPIRPRLTGPGPLRHPKPLTPSDLHLVLEKEQEAMVSRMAEKEPTLSQME